MKLTWLQGVEDKQWSFAYLVTAPRFLGYSFNPVSFWYLYDSNSKLTMMVLEVNNTFDERRMYLLKADGHTNGEEQLPDGETVDIPKHAVKFSDVWSKDFHVSPFNSRKGSYSLAANDPLDSSNSRECMIDNLIVLKSSQGHAKLVARVFSDGEARNPVSLSLIESSWFILSWSWVGLITSPRIIKEAFKLFYLRGLHVWYRPEVLPSSIGRQHVEEEEYVSSIVTMGGTLLILSGFSRLFSGRIFKLWSSIAPRQFSSRTYHQPAWPQKSHGARRLLYLHQGQYRSPPFESPLQPSTHALYITHTQLRRLTRSFYIQVPRIDR